MSNVRLNIGGRDFSVACAAGEEDHISALGAMIDSKLRAMGGASGNSESRMLLFAALLLADELHDSGKGGAAAAPAPAAAAPDPALEALPGRIDAIAGRIEKLAQALEQAGQKA
jgi:cell division protein ZapA